MLSKLLFAKGLGSPGQANGLLGKCWFALVPLSSWLPLPKASHSDWIAIHTYSFFPFPTGNSQRGFTQYPAMLKWSRRDMVIACELQFRLNEHYVYEECSSDF